MLTDCSLFVCSWLRGCHGERDWSTFNVLLRQSCELKKRHCATHSQACANGMFIRLKFHSNVNDPRCISQGAHKCNHLLQDLYSPPKQFKAQDLRARARDQNIFELFRLSSSTRHNASSSVSGEWARRIIYKSPPSFSCGTHWTVYRLMGEWQVM